jgi:hypothetical protein
MSGRPRGDGLLFVAGPAFCIYAGTVIYIWVEHPRTAAERLWNRTQRGISAIAVFLPIVLKLAGVITWSWWWVAIAPLWIGPALLALAIIVLAIQPFKRVKPWLAGETGDQGASGGHLGLRDDG